MNYSDYETRDMARYEQLAFLVRSVLESATKEKEGLPRIQTIQARAKGLESLKRKLEKRGIVEASDIESRIKDLAGARVILYSNIDVERFLQSRLIIECLTIHWAETKAHYPTTENDGVKYEGFHYVVSLPEALAAEHPDLAGLRCEVQIQTLLAHAFAESSHDIIYKEEDTPGFGTDVRERMRKRLNEMVEKYLKPAGYELDKVQSDFERLSRGQKLFHAQELGNLSKAKDNNELYDRLTAVSQYLIPHYDDLSAVAPEIHKVLVEAVEASRVRPVVDIDYGEFKTRGHSAEDIARLAVQTISDYRFADVPSTFDTLIRLYRGEPSAEIRNQIVKVFEKLATYNLDVWRQVGPEVQHYLADRLALLAAEEIENIRPIAITVWQELLGWAIDGTTWTADAVQLKFGAISTSDAIQEIRKQAIEGLTGLLDRSTTDEERRPVISAFWEAAQLPTQAQYSNETLAAAIEDLTTITDILLPRLADMDFPLWQSIESQLFREYKRFKALAVDNENRKGCRDQAKALVDAIKSVRNKMNRKADYVRYKTLVGFEGVFSQQWDNDEFEFEAVEKFRKKKAAAFVAQITDANEEKWIADLKRIAATKSADWATFPIFGEFLSLLGERKPQVALKAIATADENLMSFLSAMLTGLAKSDAKEDYAELVKRYVDNGTYLASVARHYRWTSTPTTASLSTLLGSAIAHGDDIAVIETLVVAVMKWSALGDVVIPAIFMPAIHYLTEKKDSRWVFGIWFMREAKDFFARLTEEQTVAVLTNLAFAKKIDHQFERVLACIANTYPGLVWRYFRDRLLRAEDDGSNGFQAVPYQLYDLPKVLGRDPSAAMVELRSWFKSGDNHFQFTGGRLLHAIYPQCTRELAEAAMAVTAAATSDDIDFLLNCFRPYRGEAALHPVAKMIVRAIAEDDQRLGLVEILLENTGVVGGEYGMADAMRERKTLMKDWLNDDDPKVRGFAERAIKHLDNRIATETQNADSRRERRKRDYGEE